MRKNWIRVILTGIFAILIWQAAVAVNRVEITPLERHNSWVRGNLYPAGMVRLGHILEKYVEPVKWVKIRERLLENPILIVIIGTWGWMKLINKKSKNNHRRVVRGKYEWLKPGAILVLATVIFTWQLSAVPDGIYVDEAVTGYNAWSILMTGRDEWGKAFPILFRYFGSWLPWLNLYFLVPAVKLLGLSELAVRLPAALLGVGVCLVIYVLIKLKTKDGNTAILGTTFLTVVPWMVFNARLGYEEMLGFILFAAGCGLLWRSATVKENLPWAILALSLSSYDAHVFRYLTGICLPVWLMIYWPQVRNWPGKFLARNFGWLIVTQIPHLLVVNTPAFWVKQVIYQGVGFGKILRNFWLQMVTYFSPQTMFGKIPDIDLQHQIPETGLFVWWMAVPVLWGVLGWVKNWRENKWWLAVLVMSVIPAALSGEFISVQRALPLLLPLAMAMAEGLELMTAGLTRNVRVLVLTGLWCFSGLLVYRSYFVLLPGLHQEAWNYGYKQLTEVIRQEPEVNFVIDNTRNVRNYILPLFYLAYPPGKLQSEADPGVVANYYFSGNMNDYHRFANMEFRPINWKEDECTKQVLAGDDLAISDQQVKDHNLVEKGKITGKTGQVLLKWYETNPEVKCRNLAI